MTARNDENNQNCKNNKKLEEYIVGIRERLGSIIDSAPKTKHTGTDEGDHERFSHYADKAKIVESAVTGKPVRALCGKKWIPTRDPQNFPVCPTCKEIYSRLKQ